MECTSADRTVASVALIGLAAQGFAAPELLPRGRRDPIPLAKAAIVAPASPRRTRLAEALRAAGADVVEVLPQDALDATGLRLTADVLDRTVVATGGIHTNRAVLPFYAHYLSFADALYPGAGGYTVRTITQPFGPATAAVALEASDSTGEESAVTRFIELLGDSLNLPLTFETHLAPDVQARAAKVRSLGLRYALTADPASATGCADKLLASADDRTGWFRFGDYGIERYIREYHYIQDAPGVTAEQTRELDKGLFDTLLASEGVWWRRRNGRSIGGRHQTMGTSCFTAGVHLARRRCVPNDEARAKLGQWWSECEAYWGNACSTFHDDLEGIPVYYCPEPTLDWALMMAFDGYLGEQLPRAIARALAVIDPLGTYAGTGTYEECRPGGLYKPVPWGWLLSVGEYFHPDAGFGWLRANVPNTGTGTWATARDGAGFRTFTAGRVPTARDQGPHVDVVPLGAYRHDRLAHDPADARQTGGFYIPGDVDSSFEKVAFREGYQAGDQYFVLQGYTPHSADNQPPWDANSIIRYTDLGHVWLHSNSEKSGNLFRSAVYCTDGLEQGTRASGCELVARSAGSCAAHGVEVISSRLPGTTGCDWTRHVVWKAGSYAVVIDELTRTRDGDFGLTCTWRTPQQAWLEPNGMIAREGHASFRVVNVDSVRLSLEDAAEIEGAAVPTMLRQSQPLGKNTTVFRNLLYASNPADPADLAVRPIGSSAVLVKGTIGGEKELALIAIGDPQEPVDISGFEVTGTAAYVGSTGWVSAGGGVKLRDNPDRIAPSSSIGSGSTSPTMRTRLEMLWRQSEPNARPGQTGAGKQTARRSWRVEPLSPLPPPAAAPVLTWDVEPSGNPATLTDRVVTRWATTSWPRRQDVRITIDLREELPLSRIDLHVGSDWGHNVIPAEDAYPGDRIVKATFSNDAFRTDARESDLTFTCDATFEACHKGVVYPVKRWTCTGIAARARQIRLHFDAATLERGARFNEIAVRPEAPSSARFVGHVVRDVDGDGKDELIAWSGHAEVAVIQADGTVLLSKRMPGYITSADCYPDLGHNGPRLLVTTREARLYCLDMTGEELWRVDFLESAKLNGDLPTGYSTGVIHDREGAPIIVVGNYNLATFVNPAGKVVKYQRLPAAYYTMMLPSGADFDGDGVQDIATCEVWGDLSVVTATMERRAGMRIPRGKGVALEYWDERRSRMLVCTENGLGIADLAKLEFEWLASVTPINDCAVADVDGAKEIVLAKEDGYVLAYNEAGELARKILIGQPVRAIAHVGSRLVAAVPGRLIDVADQATLALGEYRRLAVVGDTLVAMGDGGVVDAFDLPR